MAANTEPVFAKNGVIGWPASITAANTATDGTGTVSTVITGQTNGTWVDSIRVKPLGTNVATVVRIWINNGSTNATASNNALIGEITLPATTASNSIAVLEATYPINRILPNGHKINVAIGTAVSAGVQVAAFGGDL